MDELAKALAEAVRAGKEFAYPAIVGYYGVRALEAMTTFGIFATIAVIASRTILKGIALSYEKEIQLEDAKKKTYEARR